MSRFNARLVNGKHFTCGEKISVSGTFYLYRSKKRRDATRGQFSLFLPPPRVFIPGPFWPTFAEFMSWKDKGLRGWRGDGRGGACRSSRR